MYKENNYFISPPQQQINLFDWPEKYVVVNNWSQHKFKSL